MPGLIHRSNVGRVVYTQVCMGGCVCAVRVCTEGFNFAGYGQPYCGPIILCTKTFTCTYIIYTIHVAL